MAIVGAGVSGIVTARMLTEAGFDVVVFEKAADVGGVWSASRAYPGIGTQDDGRSYAFSDAALPGLPDSHPPGAEVQAYLEGYARRHGLLERVRLRTRVVRTRFDEVGWEVESDGPDGAAVERFDWLVAANGVFSTPHVPDWPGRAAFEAAGGRVVTPGQLAGGAVLHGARVVVVGWGKTACDVAAAAVPRSAGVEVVARTLVWKLPKRLGRSGLTFRHLILTRAAERLIGGSYRSPAGRLLLHRLPERVPRVLLGRAIARSVDRASGLSGLGLRPLSDIRASNSLVTEGFFEAVAEGRIRVHRDCSVQALESGSDGPRVRLTDGSALPADVVVAATGYEQRLDFLPDEVLAVAASDGALLLHRRTLGVDVPRFALAGWAHSYRSPLTSEVAAVWLAAAMRGRVALPSVEQQRSGADRFRLTRSTAVGARTAALPGVTMRDLDLMLADLGTPLPLRVRLRQIWRPIDPADYAAALAAARPRSAAAPRRRFAAAR